jgi:TRAP-type C4-dicarboxylate transport system substrate-binding protein
MIDRFSGRETRMSRKLANTIAHAIKKADKRYFFEDYTAQANAVLKALREAGMAVVPLDPPAEVIEAGKNALKYGTQRPGDMLKTLYQAMIGAVK